MEEEEDASEREEGGEIQSWVASEAKLRRQAQPIHLALTMSFPSEGWYTSVPQPPQPTSTLPQLEGICPHAAK